MLLSLMLSLAASSSSWGAPVVSAFATAAVSSSSAARSAPILRMSSFSAEWIDLQSLDSSPHPGQIQPPRSGANTISCGWKILTFAGYAEEMADIDTSGDERYVVNDLW